MDKTLYFTLAGIIHDAKTKEGAEIFPDTRLTLTVAKDSYIATLFGIDGGKLCPLLVTAGSPRTDQFLWGLMHDEPNYLPLLTKRDTPVPGPFIADKLMIPNPKFLDLYTMTGDLTRCLGWMILAHNQLKPIVK